MRKRTMTRGVLIIGRVEWHAPSAGQTDYATLCGIDPNDPGIGHDGDVAAPPGQKIHAANARLSGGMCLI